MDCFNETESISNQHCKSCCCSSVNEEFSGDKVDQTCTAPPAVYKITFTYALTSECHPDIFLGNWSRPFAASHTAGYRMWDACMDSVSDGVANFSVTGDFSGLIVEGSPEAIVKKSILDIPVFDGDEIIDGSGNTSIDLTVDSKRQYVSTLTRLALTPDDDWVVGVSELRLCNGQEWNNYVKVCFELFSTAQKSARVAGKMERNSVQNSSCSYGYVEFNLTKTEVILLIKSCIN